jgi:hypothetical protein
MCAISDDGGLMPPGRNYYRCKGPVKFNSHDFMSWLLLRVNPQYGEPYGAYFRTDVVRWRFSAVLPVAIKPDDPTDIEICWDAATNIAKAAAEKIDTKLAAAHERVAHNIAMGQDATAQSITNIVDPAMRQVIAENLQKSGMIDATTAAQAVAAPAPSALERLESLRSSGVLTDAEFETERAKLAAGH